MRPIDLLNKIIETLSVMSLPDNMFSELMSPFEDYANLTSKYAINDFSELENYSQLRKPTVSLDYIKAQHNNYKGTMSQALIFKLRLIAIIGLPADSYKPVTFSEGLDEFINRLAILLNFDFNTLYDPRSLLKAFWKANNNAIHFFTQQKYVGHLMSIFHKLSKNYPLNNLPIYNAALKAQKAQIKKNNETYSGSDLNIFKINEFYQKNKKTKSSLITKIDSLKCPINKTLIKKNEVAKLNGYYYFKKDIIKWINQHKKDPMTNLAANPDKIATGINVEAGYQNELSLINNKTNGQHNNHTNNYESKMIVNSKNKKNNNVTEELIINNEAAKIIYKTINYPKKSVLGGKYKFRNALEMHGITPSRVNYNGFEGYIVEADKNTIDQIRNIINNTPHKNANKNDNEMIIINKEDTAKIYRSINYPKASPLTGTNKFIDALTRHNIKVTHAYYDQSKKYVVLGSKSNINKIRNILSNYYHGNANTLFHLNHNQINGNNDQEPPQNYTNEFN